MVPTRDGRHACPECGWASRPAQSWVTRANCRGMDINVFFLERGVNPTHVRDAKHVCSGCEVTAECLDYALRYSIWYGIWGGTTSTERKKLRWAKHYA